MFKIGSILTCWITIKKKKKIVIEENNGHLIKAVALNQQEQIDHNEEQLQFHLVPITVHQMKMTIIMLMMMMMMTGKVVYCPENGFQTVVNFQCASNTGHQLNLLLLVHCYGVHLIIVYSIVPLKWIAKKQVVVKVLLQHHYQTLVC